MTPFFNSFGSCTVFQIRTIGRYRQVTNFFRNHFDELQISKLNSDIILSNWLIVLGLPQRGSWLVDTSGCTGVVIFPAALVIYVCVLHTIQVLSEVLLYLSMTSLRSSRASRFHLCIFWLAVRRYRLYARLQCIEGCFHCTPTVHRNRTRIATVSPRIGVNILLKLIIFNLLWF